MLKQKISVLVTGASGFVGANLVRKLLDLKLETHIILREEAKLWRIKDILTKLTVHKVDLLDKKKLKVEVAKIKPQAIFHLGTFGSYPSQADLEKTLDVNIWGTINLLEATHSIPYSIFINTGTSSEYGPKEKPMRETDLLSPISFYGAAKAGTTLICYVFAKQYNKPIVTFRPFSVYGPYEEGTRLIPKIVMSLLGNTSISLTAGGGRRDFVYVDDVTDAYIKTLSGKDLSGKILNIGTGREYSNNEVVNTLFKVVGKRVEVKRGAYKPRPWDTPHWVADISLTKKELDWQAQTPLGKGLEQTYNWFLKNRDLYDKV